MRCSLGADRMFTHHDDHVLQVTHRIVLCSFSCAVAVQGYSELCSMVRIWRLRIQFTEPFEKELSDDHWERGSSRDGVCA